MAEGNPFSGLFDDEIKFNSEYSPVTLKTQYARSKYLAAVP